MEKRRMRKEIGKEKGKNIHGCCLQKEGIYMYRRFKKSFGVPLQGGAIHRRARAGGGGYVSSVLSYLSILNLTFS